MKLKPSVGQQVRLNDEGFRSIWQTTLGLTHMKTLVMTVTSVDDESITYPEITYIMEVDDPEINMYLLNHTMFDLVTNNVSRTR